MQKKTREAKRQETFKGKEEEQKGNWGDRRSQEKIIVNEKKEKDKSKRCRNVRNTAIQLKPCKQVNLPEEKEEKESAHSNDHTTPFSFVWPTIG